MARTRKTTRDAREILSRRHPPRAEDLEQREGFYHDSEIAELVFQARAEAGLSQRELARQVGTTASTICRLEDADYEGHSMAMLRRIGKALGQRVEVRFVPIDAVSGKA